MSRQKNLKRNLLICLLAGSAVMYTLPLHAATSVVANNALPTLPMVNGQIKDGYGFVTGGSNTNIVTDGLQMNITQNNPNAVIKWGSFDVGGSATVNFKGPESGYNTLNYVNAGGSMSQIYGTINANNNGNIFIVNPAGVQIGNSAQINVGSLYVSNKTFSDDLLKTVNDTTVMNKFMKNGTANADAALMSLGNINANKVTFEGNGRIVIDSERIKNENTNLTADEIFINTNDKNNVVIGYEAYENGSYAGVDKNEELATLNGNGKLTKADGYMWVEDVKQLQAINTNLSGNYALRNSIDATSTANWNEVNGTYAGFNPIGLDETTGKVIVNNNNEYGFTGNFDGLDYNIFGLTINRESEANVGLFGVAHNANINNVTLVGGSITGGSVVGSVIGAALGNTHITNATNSASVTGNTDVGGIVGYSGDEIDNVGDSDKREFVNTNAHFTNLINTGSVYSKGEQGTQASNAGGLIGYMYNGKLDGNSYNLGDVSGKGYNVGGLVGHAVNSTIGDGTNLVYNRLDVEGAYNVGGIVGNMEGTTVQNAENSGNVTATGFMTGKYYYHTANGGTHIAKVDVNVANVGGIVGSSSSSNTGMASNIFDVQNTGDVTSSKVNSQEYYAAGNVGGVVGSAVDTNINNATNKENDVRGAHNVGGVAGYFGGSATITGGINDGGDIMATGARNANSFVMETVRPVGDANESFVIGNIGGIVGYLDGDNVYVTGSANRGTVHTDEPANPADVEEWQKAANVGGVVGKIDRESQNTLSEIKNGNEKAAVTNSYNTGDVLGYTGVGGVIGMMYNGAVSGSYNLGTVNTTRQVERSGGTNIDPLNMGGIVGDTTEETNAKAIIYDVYNKGQIGDEEFNYYARHVGGIVGRLSGDVEKAYNTGDIYNNDTVVGGIAGWWYGGTINNAFNTGNITAITATELQVGGLVGAAGASANRLTNAYNLGTIRGYQQADDQKIYLGGIVGKAANLRIDNVYTLGNLYAGRGSSTYNKVNYGGVGYIYGGDSSAIVSKAYYITAEDSEFSLADVTDANQINFANRYDKDSYNNFGFNTEGYEGSDQNKGYVSADGVWRIYDDSTTPILNAFLPNTEEYFTEKGLNDSKGNSFNSIQYGTAYDPLLTIINTDIDLSFYWDELDIGGAGSLVVYGGGLTLDNVSTSNATGGSSYYGGVLYSDGALTIKGDENENLGFGSASELYGSEVTIKADGTVTIYGDVTATGNANDNDTTGNVTINAGDVNVYGTLTSATVGNDVSISGIASQANGKLNYTGVNNPEATMPHIGDRFTYTTQNSTIDGDIIINAGTKLNDEGETVTIGSGNVNLYYGNKEEGLITAGGNLDVTGTGNVYVDSDLDIGGNLTLTGNGENSEVVLDLTNIGQVQAKNGTVTDAVTGLHGFMHHFIDTNANINLKAEKSKDTKITVDMWDGNGFNLKKFDSIDHDFKQELDYMNVTINDNKLDGTGGNHVKNYTYIWVSDGDQLQAINNNGVNGLSYNYALKNDINASDVTGYEAIGTGSKFTGTFDGRGNRIIGLDTTKSTTGNGNTLTNAGIFSTIGEGGTVKNVNIYSGNFNGTDTAGAVAGVNEGRIENVTGFGNTVEVSGTGIAGGIVGKNEGKGAFGTGDGASTLTGNGIYDVQSIGSVITASGVAGGLVGTNDGALGNSYSDSAVTSTTGTSNGLGGVVGVNTEKGDVQFVDSLGVTNGGTNSDKVGGIIGVNKGNMYSGYNESIVSGSSNVGGIIGQNGDKDQNINGTVSNVVNATSVTGSSNYVGGLVGTNTGSVTNGRNNGSITGNNYVGGLVGSNNAGSKLEDLVNAESADIVGENFVGGIAGTNSGEITADDQSTLNNLGSITGQNYVGGVAGANIGKIEYIETNISLNVKDTNEVAQYFGGVAGVNKGEISQAKNTGSVIAADADYVGGIVGLNTANGQLLNSSNAGRVEGANYVGGVAGKNEASITGKANDLVTIDNSGVVIANKGGAGGIFGENTGNIEYAELTNNGIVSGTYNVDKVAGTGGLIGVNSGEIKHSSLKNNIGGQVIGTQNVGGLIGVNTGNIEGGRDEANSYYKYQIYNNGIINVGTWNDADKDGAVDTDEITLNVNGTNIGGLFGTNSSTVKAAYNTGAINAKNSSNVGGIAGSNSGTIDQVFNTVYNTDGTKGAITGGTNVGGLVGTNSGTLSNAYNTTEVSGNYAGNAVGVNNDNAIVSNVYDVTNTNNKLIGENSNGAIVDNSYTSAKQEESADGTDGITYISANKAKDKESYKNFADGTWKFYDGYSNPLLSVFLTKVKVNQDKVNEYMNEHKVYNGSMQELTADDIKNLIENEAIFVEGLTKEEAFEAFNNNNSLISSIGYKDVGEHNDWLYSGQIAEATGNTFNPNNLGYDIELSASIAQKELTISDILANIVYGGNTYTDIKGGALTGIVNNDDVYLVDKNGNNISITSDFIADYLSGEYAKNKGDRNTANVKRDQDNNVIAYGGAIYVDGISLGGAALGNYKLADKTIGGDITVTPATLNITLNDIYRIYGDHSTIYGNCEATQNGEYGIKDVIGLVNGDQNNLKNLIVKDISDGALDDFANPTKTNDVTEDGYKWTGKFSGIDNVNSNYTITVGGGNSIVKAKTITIKDLLASIVYGNQDNKGLQINTGASLADGSIVYGDDVRLVTDNAQYTTGGAYEDSRGNRTTADVGEYTDSLFVSGLSLTGDKAENYVLDKTAAVGDIEVTKANLIINVGNAETVYGDAFNDNDYTHTLSGVTNGDSDTVIDGLLGGNYDNTVSVEAGKDTANAGTYKDALGFVNYQQLKNYDVQVENGDVIINKKQITIGANNEQIFVGETPNYSGTDINGVLVNGDSLNGNYHYGVADGTVESVTGTHTGVIGIWIGGVFYDLSQNVDWTQAGSFFSNYEVNSTPGTLTVSAYDIPEDWPHNRWDYLFNDAPFDRNKDFRERKAEVNFVDGGMEI